MKHRSQKTGADTLKFRTLWAAFFAAVAVLTAVTAAALQKPAPSVESADGNISVDYTANPETSQETDASTAGNSENIQNFEPFYVIRAYEDRIAIFENGGDVPLYRIETKLASLPEADQKLLIAGIRAETLPLALKRIEDYE